MSKMKKIYTINRKLKKKRIISKLDLKINFDVILLYLYYIHFF